MKTETTVTVHTAQNFLTTEQLAAISEEKAAQKASEKALDRAFKRFGRRQRGAWPKLRS